MIEREPRGAVTWLRITHGKANALDVELLHALADAVEAEVAGAARSIVVTGTARIFCAGADLKRLLAEPLAYVDRFIPALDRLFRTLLFLPKPVVAAVNGHAIAGGCVLACACDRRIATQGGGRIGVTELLVGLPFPASAMAALRAVLAPVRLAEAVLSGRTWPVDEAVHVGLVDEVVAPDAFEARAQATAEALGTIPPDSYALTKRQLRRSSREALDADGAATDAQVVRIWSSPGPRAALADYVARTLAGHHRTTS